MRVSVQRIVTLMAIYAVAIHTILLGLVPVIAAPTVDPFSVICHSERSGAAPAEQIPTAPVSAPGHACDQCIMGSAMAPPEPLDGLVVEQLAPARLLQILRPASVLVRDGIATKLKRARGPPSFV